MPAVSDGVDPFQPGRAERDRRRLTRRVLGGAIIVALAIVSLTGVMLWHLHEAQIEEGLNSVSALDLLVASQTERAFESIGVVLDDVSADLQAQNIASAAALRQAAGNEATFRLLRAKMAGIAQFNTLAIASSDGDVIASTRSYPVTAQANMADRDYFARLRDHPEIKVYISPPTQGADGKPMIYIGRRLNAPNGAFIGIVLGAIHTDFVADLYTNYLRALPGDGKSMALWRKDGTLLSRSPAAADAAADAMPPDLARPTPSNGLLAYWATDPHGNAIAIAQRRLDDLPLIIEVRQSASAMLTPWDSEFLATAVGGGALLLLVGVALLLLLRQLKTQALIIEERARANREAEAREDVDRARTKAEAAMRETQQSEARFRDIAEVGSDWIWETDAEHRFTMIAGARQPKVNLTGTTRWSQAGADPETDPVWREHKAVLDAHLPFRQFRFAIDLPDGRFHVCVSGKPIFADDGTFVGYRGTVSDETELVETRERAMRADALLRNAIESIAEGFVIYDAEDRFVMCNESYRTMYKENAEFMVRGTKYEDIMRAAVATGRYSNAIGREEEWLANWMHKHSNPGVPEESRLADGRWVLRSERRMADGGIAGLRIDITALKQTQEALRENQVMLNRAQKLSGTGSVVRNLATKATEWSDEMYRIFGVDRDNFEARTENFLAMIHPEDRARVEALITKGPDTQLEPPTEFRITRPDGSIRWVYREADFWRDSDDTPGIRLTTYKDITEKREADMRNRELETLLRDAIESISEGFALYDRDDRLVICNEAYKRIYPRTAPAVVPGVSFEELLRYGIAHGDYRDAAGREEEWLAERLREHRELRHSSIEQALGDGRWMLVSERRTSNGGTAGLRVDITALKHVQQSLRDSQAMLNLAQKVSGTGSVVRNLKTREAEWSDEMYRICGVTRESFKPSTERFLVLVHPEDRAMVAEAIVKGANAVAEPPIEFRIVWPSGEVRWVYREAAFWCDPNGAPEMRLTTYKDVTEKREAELRHRELEILLRDAIESISEGFVIYDKDDRLILCNEAFRRLYPNSAQRMVPGVRYVDILRGANREEGWVERRMRQHRELARPVETQLEDGRWVFISERRTSSGGTAGLRVDVTALKTAQNTLREKEAILSRAQQVAKLGTVVRDLRANTIDWSDEMFRIFGLERSDYVPTPAAILAFVHPEDRPIAEESIRRINEGLTYRAYEYRIIRPDGAVRWIHRESAPWHDGDGAVIGWLATFQDITELKEAQEALRDKEAMLSRAQRVANVGSAVHEYRTGKSQWSEQMFRIVGMAPDLGVPHPDYFLTRIVYPDDHALVKESLDRGYEGDQIPPLDYRIVRPDGAVRWVHREAEILHDAEGKPTGRLSTFQDVTELKAAQELLHEKEAMLSRAQRVANVGCAVHDFRSGKSQWSEQMFRIAGFAADAFIPNPGVFLALVYPDDRALVEKSLASGHEGGPILPLDYRIVRPDGAVRWVHREAEVLRDADGKPIGRMSTFQDVTELKTAQELLRSSQAALARAQRVAKTGSIVRDLGTGIVEWSDEMFRLYRISAETFPATPESFLALAHPDDRDKLAVALEAGMDGRATSPLEYRAILPDGTERWVRRESEVVCDAEDKPAALIATFTDITERHAAEQRQRELEVLLRDAIESISEGFVIYDANDRLVICNEGYRRIYPEIADLIVPGVQYADLLRARLTRGLQPDNGNGEEWIAQMLHRRRFSSSEPHEVQTHSGRWVLVAERRMSNGGLAGLRVDITRMKEVQQSLRDSQQRLDRTQRLAHIGAVERDLRTQAVVWSDETYRIFGVNPANYTPSAENLLGFVHPDDRPLLLDVLRRSHHEHINSNVKFRIMRPSGELRTISSQADVAYDEAGEPLYISIAMMDVTDKEVASERQVELEAQLRHSEKLTALGTLAGGIAHDINNTLVPIQALSKLVMQGLPAEAPERGDLETIYQASIQARDLVRQILAFSRKQEIIKEPTDITARMHEALHMLRASVPSTIEIIGRITPMPPILVDGTQLQQVVVNLVTNGAHAIGDGCGRVTVTLDEVPGDPDGPRLLRLSVADTGCGMSPEIVHRMFEPFFTTKSVGEGTGLGLSVVHGIVTSHGGTIDVKSTPGEGTEFIILLPARPVDESNAIAEVA